MKSFLEWMEDQTLISHYRVEDPRLAYEISSMDGTEVDMDDDESGATVTIDYITFPKTASKLKMLANQGKIRVVAGPVTRNITGKARPMGKDYIS